VIFNFFDIKKRKREKSIIMKGAYGLAYRQRIQVAKSEWNLWNLLSRIIRVFSLQHYEIYVYAYRYTYRHIYIYTCILCEFRIVKDAYRYTNELYIILTHERHYRPYKSFAKSERRERCGDCKGVAEKIYRRGHIYIVVICIDKQ